MLILGGEAPLWRTSRLRGFPSYDTSRECFRYRLYVFLLTLFRCQKRQISDSLYMAMATSKDYGLHGSQLRHWLINLVDENEIDGLEWTDDSKQEFKLPWPQKDRPGWEDLYRILRGWADNKNRQDKPGVKSDFSTLKSNFRTLLNKCDDFKLVKDETDKQSDNYKVYKVLSPKEVNLRKQKRKEEEEEKQKKREKKSKRRKTANPNLDDGKLKTVDGKIDLDMPHSHTQATFVNSIKPENGIMQHIESDSVKFNNLSNGTIGNNALENRYIDNVATYDTFHISPPPSIQMDHNWSPMSDQQYVGSRGHSHTTNGSFAHMPTDVPSSSSAVVMSRQSKNSVEQASTFQRFLKDMGISSDKFHRCEFRVFYNGNIVSEEQFDDTVKGYRICYGDQNTVYNLLPMQYFTEEQMLDFTQFNLVQLPQTSVEQNSTNLTETLKMFDLGVVFRYEPETLSFLMKRKCQSYVYYLDPNLDYQYQKPIKLDREEEICVFSYEKYLTQLQSQTQELEDVTIFVSIGSKSVIDFQNRNIVGIKMEFSPIVLKDLMERRPIKDSSNVSLCFSEATQFELLLRKLQNTNLG
uniref:uncharacterized protein LOC120337523 n=1 Tax=Styela clava TaxID=7725 RepID=UPI00193938A3|nr:uncharacterized protein LOC120337523 [Styela clava]